MDYFQRICFASLPQHCCHLRAGATTTTPPHPPNQSANLACDPWDNTLLSFLLKGLFHVFMEKVVVICGVAPQRAFFFFFFRSNPKTLPSAFISFLVHLFLILFIWQTFPALSSFFYCPFRSLDFDISVSSQFKLIQFRGDAMWRGIFESFFLFVCFFSNIGTCKPFFFRNDS